MTRYLYDKYTSIDQWTPEIKSKEISTEFSGGWTFYKTLSYSNSVGYTVSGATYSISNVPYNTIVYSQYTTNNSTLRKATALIATGRIDSMNLKATTYDLSRSFEATKKDFIETVTATDGTYPDDGKHTDGFYYVKKEIAPPLNKYLFQDGGEIKKCSKDFGYIERSSGSASASSYYTNPPQKAFDGVIVQSAWTTNRIPSKAMPEWIAYEFPKPIKVIRYEVTSQDYYGDTRAPKDFTFEAWDGKSWVTLDTQSGVNDWEMSERKQFSLSKSENYSKYRLNITANNGDTSYLSISEINFWGELDTITWFSVGIAPANKAMFDTDGMTDLSIITNEAIQQLASNEPELLCWTDEENANRSLNLTAVPLPQLLLAKEDIEVAELESISIDAVVNQSDNDLKIALSGDSGENWAGKAAVNINDLSNFKTNGLSFSEFNALSKEQLKSLCPNGKIRMAFYLEQENTRNAVEIRSVTINERLYTMTPEVESLSVLYSLLEAESPELYVSRDDGATWQKIKRDELADLSALPEGKQLRVKVVLSNGQELQALSYSWI